MKCSLHISNFLEEISSVSHSIVFLYFFAVITRKVFLSLLAIFWAYLSFSPLPFTFLFTAICKASSDNHFAFLHFFFLGMALISASCTMSQTSFHNSSGTLSIRPNPLYLSLPLYNPKGFDLGQTWVVYWFSVLSSMKSEFGKKEFMIWATVSFWSCFCWLYRASPCSAATNIINLISVFTIWWCPCVESSLVGRGCLLWPVHSFDETLLAFALLHFAVEGQIFLLIHVSLDFLLLHSILECKFCILGIRFQ